MQHHSSKASILRCSAYFMIWLITILDHCEDHRLDYTDLVGRVMSLLFNTLSRFVIAFLLRNNCLLISWLQSPSTVILEPKKRKSVTISTSVWLAHLNSASQCLAQDVSQRPQLSAGWCPAELLAPHPRVLCASPPWEQAEWWAPSCTRQSPGTQRCSLWPSPSSSCIHHSALSIMLS